MSDNKRMRDVIRKSSSASDKIREKVTKTSPGIMRYTKNVASSIAQATGEYFLGKNETIREFATINRKVFEDTSVALTNPKEFIKKQIGLVVTDELKQASSNMVDAIISDLKTGKFYDRERIARFDKSMDFDDDDSFGGYDFDDWSLDDEESIDDDTEAIIDSQYDIATKQDANDNARTAETISAMGHIGEAIIENERSIATKGFQLDIANHNSLMGGIGSMTDMMAATLEAQNIHFANLNTMIEHSSNSITDRLDKTNALLEEIKKGLSPGSGEEEEEESNRKKDRIFGNKGALNIDAYAKKLFENLDNETSMSSTFTNMTAGMGLSEVINVFADNPLAGVYNMFLDRLLPKNLKDAMGKFQDSLSAFGRNLITKISSKKGEDGFKGMISRILGVEYNTYFDPETEDWNKGKYQPKNFLERSVSRIEKSVLEVIPAYLRTIAEGITGERQKIYNYETGKFMDTKNVVDKINRDLNDMYSDQYRTRGLITQRTDKVDMSVGRREELGTSIDQLLQYYAKEQKIIDPFTKKPVGLEISNSDWAMISGALRSLSDSELQMASADAMKSKQNLSEKVSTYNDKLIDSGLISLFNEFSEDITDAISSEANLFKEREYDPKLGQFGMLRGDIEKLSGINLSNRFLNDILERLTNGIIVFPYSGGGRKGGNPELDDLRAKSFTASKDFRDQRQLLETQAAREAGEFERRQGLSAGGYGLSERDFLDSAIDKEDRDRLPIEYEAFYRSIKEREDKEKAEGSTSDEAGGPTLGKLRSMLKNPFQIMEEGFKSLDKAMFRIIFGKDASDERGSSSLFDTIAKSIMGGFDKMINWFGERFQTAKDKTQEWIEGKGKDIFNKGKDFLFAEGDEEGKGRGILSDLTDSIKEEFKGITGFGSFKDSAQLGWLMRDEEVDPKDMNLVERISYGLGRGVKNISKGMSDLFLGDKVFDKDGNLIENESQKLFREVSEEFKGFLPKGVATAGIGAGATVGLGLLTGLALPGGPLFGAILGSTAGFISHSEKFREYLFGKESVDADGNITLEKQGLIDREIVNGFKQFAGPVAGGVAIGAMVKNFGMFGTSFLPGGPIMGGLLGGIAGMTLGSKQMRELLFGEGEWDEQKQEWKTPPGLFDKKKRKSILESAGYGAAAIAGVQTLGMLGVPFMPGGLIGNAIIGIGGMLAKDNIKKFFFGEETEIELEEDELDSDGNPTGRKIKKKSKEKNEGLFGKIFKGTKEMIFEPIAKYVNESGKKIQTWFQTSIVDTFRSSLSPLKDAMEEAGTTIKNSFQDAMKNFGESFREMMKDKDGKTPGDHFRDTIINPIGNAIKKMIDGIGKILATILSAPFKLISNAMKRREEKKEEVLNKRIRNLKMQERWDGIKEKVKGSSVGQAWQSLKETGSKFKDNLLLSTGDAQMTIHGYGTDMVEDSTGEPVDTSDVDPITGAPKLGLMDKVKLGAGNLQLRIAEKAEAKALEKQAKMVEKAKLKAARQKEYELKLDEMDKIKEQKAADKAASIKEKIDTKEKKKKDRKDKNEKLASEKVKSENLSKELESERKKNMDRDKERDASGKDSGSSDFVFTRKFRSSIISIKDTLGDLYNEVRGQINGVGWNIEYIRNILLAKFGPDLEVAEPDGEARSSFRKRGFFSRQIDRVKRFVKGKAMGVVDWFGDKIEAVKDSKIFRALKFAKDTVGNILEGGMGMLRGLGEGALAVGKGIWNVGVGVKDTTFAVLGAIKDTIKEGFSTFGGMLADLGLTITGAARDLIGGLGSIFVGGADVLKVLLPELAKGAVGGVKFVGKGLWKAGKFVGKGIGNLAAWGMNKLFSGKEGEMDTLFAQKVTGRLQVDVMSIRLAEDIASILNPVHLVASKIVGLEPMTALPVYIAGSAIPLGGGGGSGVTGETETIDEDGNIVSTDMPNIPEDEWEPVDPNEGDENESSLNFIERTKMRYKAAREERARKKKEAAEEANENREIANETIDTTRQLSEAEDINRTMKQVNRRAKTKKKKEALDRAIQIETMKKGGGAGSAVEGEEGGKSGLAGLLASLLGGAGLAKLASIAALVGGLLMPLIGTFTAASTDMKLRNAFRFGNKLTKGNLGKAIKNAPKNLMEAPGKLVNKVKGIGRGITSFGTEAIGGFAEKAMKSNNKTIANWGTKTLDKVTSPKVAKAVGNAATEAATNKGAIGKIIGAFKKLFDGKAIKKLGGSKVGKNMGKFWNLLAGGLTKSGKIVGDLVGKIFSKISLGTALLIYDLTTGMAEAANIMMMRKEDINWKHRAAAGIAKVLAGFLIIIPDRFIADLMMQALMSEAEYAAVEDSREALELRYQEYVAQGGELEFEKWVNQENIRVFDRVTTGISSLWKGKKYKERKEYKETMTKVGDTPTGADLTAQRLGKPGTVGEDGHFYADEDPAEGIVSGLFDQMSLTKAILGPFGILLKNMISVMAGAAPDITGINTALGSLTKNTGMSMGNFSFRPNLRTGGFSPNRVGALPELPGPGMGGIRQGGGLPTATTTGGGGGGSAAPAKYQTATNTPATNQKNNQFISLVDPNYRPIGSTASNFGPLHTRMPNQSRMAPINSMEERGIITTTSMLTDLMYNGVPYYTIGNASAMNNIKETDKRMLCGPLAASMVISAYTGRFTPPAVLLDFARKNNFVAADGLIDKDFIGAVLSAYGIESGTATVKQSILETEMGKSHGGLRPVILLGQFQETKAGKSPTYTTTGNFSVGHVDVKANTKVNDKKRNAQPFTEAGHYVVVVDYSVRDNKFLILDPYGSKTGWYMFKDFKEYIREMFITKFSASGEAGKADRIKDSNSVSLPNGWQQEKEWDDGSSQNMPPSSSDNYSGGRQGMQEGARPPSNIDELLALIATEAGKSVDRYWGFDPPNSEPFSPMSAAGTYSEYGPNMPGATPQNLLQTGSENVSGMRLRPMEYDPSLKVTSKFGMRIHPKTKERQFHNGIDLAYSGGKKATRGAGCYAVANGKVAIAKMGESYGNFIVIIHEGFSTLYAHLDKMFVSPGDTVRQGQSIGLVGNTGRSTGPHLHFEVRTTTDINGYWTKDSKGVYKGAVDPVTFNPGNSGIRVAGMDDVNDGYNPGNTTNPRTGRSAGTGETSTYPGGPMPFMDDDDEGDDFIMAGPMPFNPSVSKAKDFNSKVGRNKQIAEEREMNKHAITQMAANSGNSEEMANLFGKMYEYMDKQIVILSKIADNTDDIGSIGGSNTNIVPVPSQGTSIVEGKPTRMQQHAFSKANSKM